MRVSTRVGGAVRCWVVANSDNGAVGAGDLAAHHAIRHAVFVREQGIFAESDLDDRDIHAATRHILGYVGDVPAGSVRIFPLDPADPAGDWQGDRLAVLPEYRSSRLGAPLVRFAVAIAGALGGRRMIAHVQPANLAFFLRLGWTQRGAPETYVGRPHLPMEIALRRRPGLRTR